MKKRKSLATSDLLLKAAFFGAVLISVSGCFGVYDPPSPYHEGPYSDGYYYDYPYDNHYYRDSYRDNCSAYNGDYDNYCGRADERDDVNHTHDLNFHNRDDYDHYDR